MSAPRRITRSDIMDMTEYGKVRREQRRMISEVKKLRRVEVGPYATFYFENYDTMWHQVQEMLFIERGGDAQVEDELAAYNPLIPQGSELVATVMFEIEDPARRSAALHALGGIENHMLLSLGGETIRGQPDATRENTSPEGKASSVQFVRFSLSDSQKRRFAASVEPAMIGFDHPHYGHLAMIPQAVRTQLAGDFAL